MEKIGCKSYILTNILNQYMWYLHCTVPARSTLSLLVACMLQHAFLIWRVAAPSPRLKFPVPFSSAVRGKDKYIQYDQRAENCTRSAQCCDFSLQRDYS